MPFAVIGSNCVVDIGDKRVRARQYPWGLAEVENKSHCDFRILRDMLIRTHMQDLIDVTSVVHYENFRARKLSNVMSAKLTGKSPMGEFLWFLQNFNKFSPAQIDEERREHKLKMKKMEKEMETVFATKVEEKKNRLMDSEKELKRKHENVSVFSVIKLLLGYFSQNCAMSKTWPSWSSDVASLKLKKPSGRRKSKMKR